MPHPIDLFDPLFQGQRPSAVLARALELFRTTRRCCQGVPSLQVWYNPSSEFADIEDPDDWTRVFVRPTDPRANCWSLDGAITRSINSLGIVPPALWEWLDSAVVDYVRLRKLTGLLPAPALPQTAYSSVDPELVYFADRADPRYLLEFLVYATTLLELEGK